MDVIEKKPKVSVCVMTYNQEKYIRQCLQSIVDQKTDFDFEVIVGDDCSTDDTRTIVKEFAEKYPTVIRTIFQEKNTGGTKNYLDVHAAANGEYIAHIDGDDCALPGKLQAQADCLDVNEDVSFAVHAVKIMGTDKLIGRDARYPTKGSLRDLLRFGTYFAHSSVMYRKKYRFPHSNEDEVIDYCFYIEFASKGSIFLDRKVLGYYRVHEHAQTRNLLLRQMLENRYEAAFDRALELGAAKEDVQSARMNRRMAFAIARYLSDDVDGYKNKIKINKGEFGWASKKHLFLHWTRSFPILVGIYMRIRKLISKLLDTS